MPGVRFHIMSIRIVTKTLQVEDLWVNLKDNISLFKQFGINDVMILFGFAWGNYIYEKDWVELPTSTDGIENLILKAEKEEHGKLGFDDLYIKIPDINTEFQYCHETDIHLTFSEPNELVQAVRTRWISNGWLDKKYQC